MEAKLTLSSHFLLGGVGGYLQGVKSVLWVNVVLRGPTCQAIRPSRVAGWLCFMAALTFPP
jgi:hypothetical protein